MSENVSGETPNTAPGTGALPLFHGKNRALNMISQSKMGSKKNVGRRPLTAYSDRRD